MPALDRRAEAVRAFNRFYTREIGLLREGLLRTPYSLTEARVLYELAHLAEPTAADIGQRLSLDAGYLSRILKRFEKDRLLTRAPAADDARRRLLALTPTGHKQCAALDTRSHDEIRAKLGRLSQPDQERLVEALETVQRLLGAPPAENAPYVLRPHRPGDMGWVVSRHGALYAEEYGWDESFEALVAEITAAFIRNFDAKRERCWIAERNGEPAGSIFLVRKTETVAQLRLLLVEPSARGLGMGRRLVEECLRFARQAGYRKVVLWTNSVLHAARHIYERAGFRLVEEEKHHSFGHHLVGQNWELQL